MRPTCDPDGGLHYIAAAPGLLCRHEPISAEWQVVIVAGNQVPGDSSAKQEKSRTDSRDN